MIDWLLYLQECELNIADRNFNINQQYLYAPPVLNPTDINRSDVEQYQTNCIVIDLEKDSSNGVIIFDL